jgi:hypothetical protein
VRLAYIDESYTSDFYFIGAVVVDDASAPALERALGDVAERARKAFLRGLDCVRHLARYSTPWPEHEVVLQHMLERLDEFGQQLGEQILVIADEIDDPNRHRANLHDFRITGTPGYRSSQLLNILDTLHFVPSQHSRLIQAADLVAFLRRRRTTVVETNPKQAQAIERLWGHVAGRVKHQLLTQP